jgi:hypothetical protein
MIEEPKHFSELCRQVGFVVLQAQIVEHNLALYLATSLRLERKEAMEKVQQALASANTKTIERLLKNAEKDFPLEPSLAKRIWDVKEERNWLVHRLQREAPHAVCSEAEVQPIFQRIQRLAKSILSVLTDLNTVGDNLMKKHGFNSAQPLALKERTINKAADASLESTPNTDSLSHQD